MSFEKMLRELVREEVARAVGPLAGTVDELKAQTAVINRLASALGQPLKRGPGRPRKVAVAGRRGGKRRGRPPGEKRGCALIGCKRPARSKGYCAAHYQKYRMLDRTHRLPSDWTEHASPNSVKDVVLPRGRAGSKALAEAKKKTRG